MAKPKVVKETPAKTKKIVDVAHPDDTLPSETSKPVIISHRPLMRDPMMAPPKEAESPAPESVKLPEPIESTTAVVMKHERRLVPPSEAKAAQDNAVQAEPAVKDSQSIVAPDEPVSKMITLGSIKPQADAPAVPVPEEPVVAKKTEEVASKPYTVTEAPSKKEEPLSPEAQEAKDAEEEEKRQKNLEKLIEDGTYFLPVGAVSHKKAMRKSLIVSAVVLVLGAAWLVAALDAGLIKIEGLDAPTDFFAN